MPQILMYTTQDCPYCDRARHLLNRKGVAFEEIPIDGNPEQRQVMIERSGRHTVPQIFINERHIGGYDDLAELDAFGKLDPLLET